MKYIELPAREKRRLVGAFGVSAVTVWSALRYRTDSPLADRIREAAREAGGTEMYRLAVPAGFVPDCATEYLREDGRLTGIVQTFGNGVSVVLDCTTDSAQLRQDGAPIKTYCGVTLEYWPAILCEAQTLAHGPDIRCRTDSALCTEGTRSDCNGHGTPGR